MTSVSNASCTLMFWALGWFQTVWEIYPLILIPVLVAICLLKKQQGFSFYHLSGGKEHIFSIKLVPSWQIKKIPMIISWSIDLRQFWMGFLWIPPTKPHFGCFSLQIKQFAHSTSPINSNRPPIDTSPSNAVRHQKAMRGNDATLRWSALTDVLRQAVHFLFVVLAVGDFLSRSTSHQQWK